VADHPGLGDHRWQVGRPADDVPAPENLGQSVDAVDAVLEGDHRSIGAEQRSAGSSGGLGVVAFDREQDDVDRADGMGIVGRFGRVQVDVAELALESETAGANGVQMGAAGNEGNPRAGGRETGAKAATQPTTSHHRKIHLALPFNAYALV
jgi:hypothetical protein